MDCYYCGLPLKKSSTTREHIPPKSLYRGFEKPLETDIITIPACEKCNNYFGKTLDEEFRNFIAVISKDGLNDGLKNFADRAMKRNIRSYFERYKIINGQKVLEFDFYKIRKFHLKNFKGLFYFRFGNSISDDKYKFTVDIDKRGKNPNTKNFIKYSIENFDWRISGHTDIFRYILVKIEKEKLPFVGYPFNDSYTCLIDYNQVHATHIMAINKEEFNIAIAKKG